MCLIKRTLNLLDRKRISCSLLFYVLCVSPAFCLFTVSDIQKVALGIGQSEVLEFAEPIKRIAIANPDVADASVVTPTQILINGKSLGRTSMIVWDESERHIAYQLIVHSEASSHQVMLRVRFAEVNRGALKELGVSFLVKNKKLGSERLDAGSFAGKVIRPIDPFVLPFPNSPEQDRADFRESALTDNVEFFLSIPTQNISAVIHALEEKNLLTTLAKPNLSAISGSEASFLVGGEIPIPIVSGATGQVSVHYKEFGIRLKFIPTVLDSQLVNIEVSTEVSSLDFENGVIVSGFRIPALITRRTETVVELNDGEHFVIGGLISTELAETVARVPVLGSVPILGKLFSSSRFQNNESELIMMIAPTIIQTMREDTIPELRN
jgi:pilus assembly protein CpaC